MAKKTFSDARMIVPKPMPAASIWITFAVRSPAAVAKDRRKPFAILFDIMSSWLGPGVLMSNSTATT